MQSSLLHIPRSRWTIALATAAGVLSVAITGLHLLAQSEWFEQKIRELPQPLRAEDGVFFKLPAHRNLVSLFKRVDGFEGSVREGQQVAKRYLDVRVEVIVPEVGERLLKLPQEITDFNHLEGRCQVSPSQAVPR